MRLSQHFGRTLREAPADVPIAGAAWLMRAGMIRASTPGVWSYLPLGEMAINRLETLLSEELESFAAEEVDLHEEASLDGLVDREVESYKDLPRTLFQTRREGISDNNGLIALREQRVHQSLSLQMGNDHCRDAVQQLHHLHLAFFAQCGLPVLIVNAETGATTFALPHPQGHEQIAHCPECGILSMLNTAAFDRGQPASEPARPLEKVATPDCKTIADLCAFLGVEAQQTLKAVFVTLDAGEATEQTALVMLRGDLDVSDEKVKAITGAGTMQPATEAEIRERIGATPGYASPIGIREDALVIVDESIHGMANFVTGANEADVHYRNANYPRDFAAGMVVDIALAYPGAGCLRCDGVLMVEPAAILGRTTMKTLKATYLDASGTEQPVIVGSTQIALDQVVCAIADLHHDEHGIVWPEPVAPYPVHIVCIAKSNEAVRAADGLYEELRGAGFLVLYDDRNLSPGVMFADADLIGIPLRITISPRSLENGGYEIKWRQQDERTILPVADAFSVIGVWLARGLPPG